MDFDYFRDISKLMESDPSQAIEKLERYENNSKKYPVNLHYAYNEMIKIYYKRRDDEFFLNKCIEICKKDIELYPLFKENYIDSELKKLRQAISVYEEMESDMGLDMTSRIAETKEEIKNFVYPDFFIPSFSKLAIIYEKQKEYEKAIEVSKLGLEYGLSDGTQGGFEGRIDRLKKKLKNPPKPVKPPSDIAIKKQAELESASTNIVSKQHMNNQKGFMITFSKSTSKNFERALSLAQQADQFEISTHKNQEIYQALFHHDNYLNFITLYELIGNWKSTFVFKDGEMMDRKVLGQINYCYGDKIRTGSDSFCYGASMFTENPFGCHRLMIHSGQRPWYEWKRGEDNKYVYIDKESMRKQIDERAKIYHHCPAFDYKKIMAVLNDLPNKIDKNSNYYKSLHERNHVHNITIKIDTEQKPPIETTKKETKKKTGCASTALLLISVPGIVLSSIYYLF
ncbi:tetratricopeptide repeat protein [Oceanobacillus aidingensis]|uniref:Tetratricopeptide repeat protein n=1 Tax=Oceanobacillus aidingensis TaxID=645964 RepID=A0ABV9JVG5_9BACI